MSHEPRNQSGYVPADFWTQWGSVNPRMCLCVKVTSTAAFGSTVLGFTSNTRDMLLPVGHSGVTFKASPGMSPTVVEQSLDEPSNLEFTGVYQTGSFTQTDVIAGKWAFAEIEVFSVCWDNVNLGEFLHFKGNLGEFKDYGTYFTCEGRGLIARLSQDVDKVTSRLCRVKQFRDAECGHTASTVVISSVTYNITQTGIRLNAVGDPTDTFLTIKSTDFSGSVPIENFYANGMMTATSGPNSGVSREIAYNATASGGTMDIQLKRSFPYAFAVNNTVTLIAGCNRTQEDCIKFSNIVNRRAEDFVPGLETVNRLPSTT